MSEKNYRTIAIRLDESLHAQISLVAQLDGVTLVDAIREAIQTHITAKRGEGDLASRAAAALEEIERESAARRQAIQALFGGEEPEVAPPVEIRPVKGRPGRRGGDESS